MILLEQECGTKCPSVVPSSLSHPGILWLCHAELRSHSQPGHGQGTAQHDWGFWSSTEVQEKLNVEFWRGTDGGFQQQSVVVIKYYSFYKKKFTFLIWICNLKSLCDFGFLNWMLTSGFLFLPALLVILHMDKGESSPSSVCLDPSLSSRHPAHPVQPATFLCSRNLQLLALQVPCKPKNGSWANPVQL